MTFFVGLVMLVTGEQTDIPPKAIVGVSAALMVLGALIGAATYFLAPQVSERERVIRLSCDEVFGLAADPALLDEGFAAYWAGLLEMRLDALGISDFLHAAANPEPYGPETRRLLLVRVRAQIALDPANSRCEQITDRLLPLVPEGREMVRSR